MEPSVLLLVEGRDDALMARWTLKAAQYPLGRLTIRAVGGKYRIASELKKLGAEAGRCAALLDLDERSVPDAVARARDQLGQPTVEVFCAIPAIEAWLFADDNLALSQASLDEETASVLRRIPLPEEIPNPKELARVLFGPPVNWAFMQNMDVQRASARCPSLRAFLTGMGRLLGVSTQPIEDSVSRSLSRNVFAGLLAEIVPSDAIAWRTASGETLTAAALRKEIESGTELGHQYASDLLRVSRDFLRRIASRAESRTDPSIKASK
ncbi:MAG TPA: hypothetical protein PKL17_20260 [Pseudomonadota bacterium]|jgi:hypothetical protein|nr:hypothetical protein [Pseudomonadota bacterium]